MKNLFGLDKVNLPIYNTEVYKTTELLKSESLLKGGDLTYNEEDSCASNFRCILGGRHYRNGMWPREGHEALLCSDAV